MPNDLDTADILWRVKPIAAFLGLSEKAAQHRIDKGEVPTFRMGGTICARRSTLLAWIAAQEARVKEWRREPSTET